jgi:hypothetical protein
MAGLMTDVYTYETLINMQALPYRPYVCMWTAGSWIRT